VRPIPGPGGRPRAYGPEVAAAAEVLWQASGRIGAHRLPPFIPELLERLVVWGELTVSPDVEKLLRQISRPTLARVLEPARAQFPCGAPPSRGRVTCCVCHRRPQTDPVAPIEN